MLGLQLLYHKYAHHAVFAAVGVACFVSLYKATRAWIDVIRLGERERVLTRNFVDPLVRRITPKDKVEIHALRMRLQQAGMRGPNVLQQYTRWRVGFLLGGALMIALLVMAGVTAMSFIVAVGLTGYVSYFGVDLYVDRVRQGRQQQIDQSLPSLMDLMVLCLDVGLSVESSFDRVTSEMRALHPLMAEEAALMGREMGAGLTFAQALGRMAERVGTDTLQSLARLIGQASQLGASVATALREFSEAAMTKRSLALEERAGKIGSIMTMPLVVCLLPAIIIVLMGPAIIDLIAIFHQV